MDQRRYLFFVLLTMVFFMLWIRIAPVMFPGLFPAAVPPEQQAEVEDELRDVADEGVLTSGSETPKANDQDEVPVVEERVELPEFADQTVMLGEGGFDANYFLQAQLNSRGGSVDWIQLTDPRYKTLDEQEQLKVVGNPIDAEPGQRIPKTFETSIPQLDTLLAEYGTSLAEVNWEIVSQDNESVTFRYPSPDGSLEVLKSYRLEQGDPGTVDDAPQGYLLDFEITVRNISSETVETAYLLQGPVGVPLENAENTRSFREFDVATIEDLARPDRINPIHLTAAEFVDQIETEKKGGNKVVAWREPIHYAGLDVQFFTALILPNREGQTTAERIFEAVSPQLLSENKQHPERSDMSLRMESTKQKLAAGEDVTHSFRVFIGPKRTQLLAPLNADAVVRLGWFGLIAKAMLAVLDFFHSVVGLPYAFAIILLTVCVRGAMFPISKKQAIESEKMRVLAPKLKEIQEKHKDKPEEFAKAYRAFQKKYNYHPMVGCLPALLQLPIFYGLYTSLYQAVDLRLAKFLWIENLAAPDALFELGFTVPWFGYTEFNLLPILTVGLFILQQKMFTPPPTSEEQAMTYKMMNIMMIAIGFAFYRVPAGLCLYFISSSLWGICERTLLKKQVKPDGTVVEAEEKPNDEPGGLKKKQPQPKPDKGPSLMDRLRQAADEAQKQAHGTAGGLKYSNKKKSKKKNSKRS